MGRFAIVLILFTIAYQSFCQESEAGMALIPGGEFTMGKDSDAGYDFSPAHRVLVDSFYMDIHEVSNRQYQKFCEASGNPLPEFWNTANFRCGEAYPDHPVVGVSWVNANKYANWTGKRLPTEAEWEYAARGSLTNKEFPNGMRWPLERAQQDSGGWQNLIYPVGQHEPNGYGLYNMGGNVWEWVFDIYSETYYQDSPSSNPKGPEKGSNRVIRSGSWHSGAMCKKVYYRKGIPGSWCDYAVGFRCVKDIN
ncbi:formylglycine-generating enzyme family protein [Bacteroidota bacterium]